MKTSILKRIKELGGNINRVTGKSLQEDILSITFNTVLYQKTTDTPWGNADTEEPIYGIGEFIEQQLTVFETDKDAFYHEIIKKYYCLTKEGFGQTFWVGQLFTPFREGTPDFEEWNGDFMDDEMINLDEIVKLTKNPKSDFILLFYDYGCPDHLYISLSDPNPDNPTLFGTDHETFFSEISNEGTLEDYLNSFMTKEELLSIVKNKLEHSKDK